jgi:AraC family transcriptional regulator, regulatory protein of adaptative response / methylated-DNA-[protein]-cysteine methyltransferase
MESPTVTTQTLDATEAETLRLAYSDTALGTIVVVESIRGVVALFIGDDRAKLLCDLKDAFPDAQLVLDQPSIARTAAKAATLVDTPYLGTDLTLDLRGSPVQLAVWEALQAIPPGETRTYGAVAQSLPITATAQDVGAACAANRIAVAVPCHRVVKSDGSLSGYRWGVWRKHRLINMEGAAR